ncbi:hypothetical protein NDU88_006190 [Pleurodeles waltl]|uniref:Uncharacterized protein n=1 Tax=Pleurodeles waltl TaxID=8319 RepID=A0AAV7X0Z9_PLEWA|nr:hypothetical protein NDU88_006190 [Pleurodeles waltl]
MRPTFFLQAGFDVGCHVPTPQALQSLGHSPTAAGASLDAFQGSLHIHIQFATALRFPAKAPLMLRPAQESQASRGVGLLFSECPSAGLQLRQHRATGYNCRKQPHGSQNHTASGSITGSTCGCHPVFSSCKPFNQFCTVASQINCLRYVSLINMPHVSSISDVCKGMHGSLMGFGSGTVELRYSAVRAHAQQATKI